MFRRPPLAITIILYAILCWACVNGCITKALSPDGCWVVCLVVGVGYASWQVQKFWHKPISRYRPRCKYKTKSRRYYVYGTKNKPHRVCYRGPKVSIPVGSQVRARFLTHFTGTRNRAATLCCVVSSKSAWNGSRGGDIRYDSDSFQIALDNCASTCFTNNMNDFCEKPTKVRQTVTGLGKAIVEYKGTVLWCILDDQGRKHEFRIPNTHYQPSLPFRLLSPQRIAQVQKDHEGTGTSTTGSHVELFWGGKRYKRTVPLNDSNIAVFWSAPGNLRFSAFATQFEEPPVAVTDDEDDEQVREPTSEATSETRNNPSEVPPEGETAEGQDQEERDFPLNVDFFDEDRPTEPQSTGSLSTKQAELLSIHCRLGHTSFARIKAMAKCGLIKSHIANVPPPMCASCQYGKATRRPWRTKAKPGQAAKLVVIKEPGDCVSVDQLESPTPGFIGQIKGFLTTQRYRVATVFVDHHSRLGFVYLQHSTGDEETIRAKNAFEAYSRSHGVIVRHYHADNGIFAANKWLAHTEASKQSITFCGVGAHFQNGVAEKRIRDLQETARTMMLHATNKWPVSQSISLWPYALRLANQVNNSTPIRDTQQQSPIEIFSRSRVRPKLTEFHQFGSPIYILRGPLQNGQHVPKWQSRARLGIYLGMSPKHARSVALVLNPRTGLVSTFWNRKLLVFHLER